MRAREVYEIFEEFSKAKNKAERLQVLEQYKSEIPFKDVLRGTFDDMLVFKLPAGTPPYTPNKPQSSPSSLLRRHKEFGLFVENGPGATMPAFKRELKFIQMLESIHPKDAEIVLAMVSKTSPVKFLTKKLVEEAYPGLIRK